NSNGRLTSIDDQVVARAKVNPIEPELSGPLPNLQRRVFEVPTESTAAGIQSLMAAAARQDGTRPVVHFAHGTYSISETLTIPASDIQLAGDGYGTVLRWTGSDGGPLLRLI